MTGERFGMTGVCEGGSFRTRLNHDCHDVGMIAMIPSRPPSLDGRSARE